ncbi:terpene synthase family protein [Actinokineospora sp. G85]|uniref:terpene synthase family protein n=1 Tax=Actinokineospora sp. G85 TaxID=3406626 RepID=UPI003C76C608
MSAVAPLDQAELDAGWAALGIPQLLLLDAAEQRRVRAVSRAVADLVEPWVAAVSDQYRGLSWPLAVNLAAVTPELSAAQLAPLVKLSCWTLVFDDAFDNHHLAPAEYRERIDAYFRFLDGDETTTADPIVGALAHCRDELRAIPLFAELEPEWHAAQEATLRAMVMECRWRHDYAADGTLPTFDEFMDNAVEAVDSRPTILAVLAAIGDRSVLAEREFVTELSTSLAWCIRVANDLRTYAKEAGEGTVNSVLIRSATPAGLEGALDGITEDLRARLLDLAEHAEKPRTATGRAERWVHDCARFVAEFYARHEYRTLFDEES